MAPLGRKKKFEGGHFHMIAIVAIAVFTPISYFGVFLIENLLEWNAARSWAASRSKWRIRTGGVAADDADSKRPEGAHRKLFS